MAVYLVKTLKGERLVEAANAGQAKNFVIQDEIEVTNLNVTQLAQCLRSGMTLEEAQTQEAEDVSDIETPEMEEAA